MPFLLGNGKLNAITSMDTLDCRTISDGRIATKNESRQQEDGPCFLLRQSDVINGGRDTKPDSDWSLWVC
jgi:hypothetical protein